MKTLVDTIALKNKSTILWIGLLAAAFAFTACEKDMEGKIYQVSDEKMIDEILEDNSDLSSFMTLIDISGLRGTVHAYGTYTLFAPVNAVVDQHLAALGKSLGALTKDEALKIVGYHLVSDTIATSGFVDGRLSAPNFNKQYIITKTVNDESGVYVQINRQARILDGRGNLKAANGYVHVVDKVLSHSTKSINDVILELPETYSLWKEAFFRSGIDETLDLFMEIETMTFTCFIQSNAAFASAGIHTMEELIAELKTKNLNETNEDILLTNFVAYHVAPGLNYVVDLMSLTTVKTLVKDEVIILKRDIDQVLLNEFEIGGEKEEGIPINRSSDYTDLSCSNGVMQDIAGNIQIVQRNAYRIYWDLGEQPEIMALKGFRKNGTKVTYANGELSGIKWENGSNGGSVTYQAGGYPSTITKDNNYIYGDYLTIRLSTTVIKAIEFRTPLLVPGTYKVYLTYRRMNKEGSVQTVFKQEGQDDQLLGIVSPMFGDYNRSPSSYGMEAYDNAFFQKCILDGYKHHSACYRGTESVGRLLGIIVVTVKGQHWLRLEAMSGNDTTCSWDQMLFIPIDDDQAWPQQDVTGKLIYESTPKCEIYPYPACEEPEEEDE